ncbi:hypothetical protein PCORN_00615 [Listeria cornellensis FSL F6-0969]|uniref:Uncharacterized protein n=1 Tax=Listeria cornellensis FSL F6-0969 TaxID=1265820 RepID=W7C5I4_9LIST|nr:hypothetical protein PCORN_00615 [Listeria cornellensis FSL F6-0969]
MTVYMEARHHIDWKFYQKDWQFWQMQLESSIAYRNKTITSKISTFTMVNYSQIWYYYSVRKNSNRYFSQQKSNFVRVWSKLEQSQRTPSLDSFWVGRKLGFTQIERKRLYFASFVEAGSGAYLCM